MIIYNKQLFLLFLSLGLLFFSFTKKWYLIIVSKKIMTHKIGMMMSSKQPPAGHNKYYFLKVNIKDYYHAQFQVYIIYTFPIK